MPVIPISFGTCWRSGFFGSSAERSSSKSEYLELFFASGLIGTFFTFIFTPGSPVPHMGASGAINGLMAYYFLSSAGRSGGGFWNGVKAYWLCGAAMALFIFPDMILAAAQSKGAAVGNIGYLAHAGGAVGGWIFYHLKDSSEPARVLAHPRRTVPVARAVPAPRRVGRYR